MIPYSWECRAVPGSLSNNPDPFAGQIPYKAPKSGFSFIMFSYLNRLVVVCSCCLGLTISPPIPLTRHFKILIFSHCGTLTEHQSAQISKIKNGGLDLYGAEPFERQQFGTAGIEGVNCVIIWLLFDFVY